jgi:hypothetical protein
MGVEIRPEPTPEEREAIVRALGALEGHEEHTSAWWQAGVGEAVESEPEESAG